MNLRIPASLQKSLADFADYAETIRACFHPDGFCVICAICETFLLICEKSAYLRNLRETFSCNLRETLFSVRRGSVEAGRDGGVEGGGIHVSHCGGGGAVGLDVDDSGDALDVELCGQTRILVDIYAVK